MKIYASLGFLPEDYRLMPIYEICEEFGLPITTHVGGETNSTYDEVVETYDIEGNKFIVFGKNRREKAFYMNDPLRWTKVLEKFPKLRLNFAHFGSNYAWDEEDHGLDYTPRIDTILSFLQKYENTHADFAFNFIYENTHENYIKSLLENELLRSKALFGTDYWVTLFSGNLLDGQEKFFNLLDNETIHELVTDNPYTFFFGNKQLIEKSDLPFKAFFRKYFGLK